MRRLLLALLLAGGCKAVDASGDEVPTVLVEDSATFVRKVSAEGLLKAVEATPITAPQDAKRPLKIAWLAPNGSEVKEGQVVIKFDASEMENKLANSRDDVTASRRKISKEQVVGKSNRSKRDESARLADVEAEVAREFESDDEDILSRNEIIESTIDVELAEAKAKHARRVKGIETRVSGRKLELIGIDKRQAAAEVGRAEEGLQNLQVKAPHDGILVLKRNWKGEAIRVGESAWRGQKLAELPLTAQMEAQMYVLEADAGNLSDGLPADVVIEAHPDVVYEATIKKIDALAQPKHHEVPVHYFGVTLQLAETDRKTMRVGQRVRAVIRVEVPDAITVPRQAVFDREGKTVVYREHDGDFEPVEVELGAASAGRVVVESGIEPGDRVALRDPTKAADELLGGGSGGAKTDAKQPGGPGQ